MENKTLKGILEKYIEIKEERPIELSIGKFYPSSVGKCNRAIVYQMLGYPKQKPNLRTFSILENGTYFHDRIEKMFRDSGHLIASELPFKDPELKISGRLDLIIKNPIERKPKTPIQLIGHDEQVVYEGFSEELAIVELKSISDKGFARLTDGKEEHKDQVTLYMSHEKIYDSYLLYENKNTQELAEFYVPFDSKRAERIIEKIKFCGRCFEDNVLPEKSFMRNDFECIYCDYRELCWPSIHKYNISDAL